MAKNWTMKEAAKEVLANNKEAIVDIGRRFPLTMAAIIKTNGNEGALDIINALPDHITARKIESVLKDGVQEIEEDETVEEAVEEKEEKAEKPAKKAPAKKAPKKAEVEETADEEDGVDYDSMTAPELYKLCKKRGIKVEPKQKAATYVKALKDADSADSDDQWDEEEEEAKPAKKAPAKKEAKPAKKPAPKKEAEEDEDDDWDI